MEQKPTRRMTRQRQVILEELRNVTSHPTADQLHQMVRHRLPGISIATVYRNLELLADEGKVLKLDVSGQQRRFDGTPEPHYHIRCMSCGRVDDVHMVSVPGIQERAAEACGYQVLSHSIEFSGICPECSSKG